MSLLSTYRLIVNWYVVGSRQWTDSNCRPYHRVRRLGERAMASKTQRFRQLIEAEEILIQPDKHFLTAAQKQAKYGNPQ